MKFKNKLIAISTSIMTLFIKINYVSANVFDIGDPLGENQGHWEFSKASSNLGEFFKFAMVSINGLAAIGLLTSVLAFAVNAFKLTNKSNPKERSEAINHMVTISIVTAILGCVPLLMWVFALIAGIA